MLIPSSAPLSARHPVTPTPRPPPLPLPLVRFPELGVSHVLSPSLIFPETVTEHERLLTLGNKQGVVEGEVGRGTG